ncbi:hypothetical protein T439DRAFT_325825 [Meredithblackwellia eburnea MCA 4105]
MSFLTKCCSKQPFKLRIGSIQPRTASKTRRPPLGFRLDSRFLASSLSHPLHHLHQQPQQLEPQPNTREDHLKQQEEMLAKSLLNTYTRNFERRPYLTLFITNGVLMALGDCCAQTIFSGSASAGLPYDIERTLRFLIFGSSVGPLAGAWNKFLEVTFPLKPTSGSAPTKMKSVKVDEVPIPGLKIPPGAKLERGGPAMSEKERGGPGQKEAGISWVAIGKRVAADQFIMAPISLFIFLFSMSLLEGLDSKSMQQRFANNYFPILFANWTIWPILQAVNFRFIPLKYRVPFGATLGILWTGFLSLKTQQTAKIQLAT